MSQPLIEVKNLKVHFPVHGGIFYQKIGNVYAVDGVSFTLESGQTVGVVGESGCGKTTLGRAVLNLYKPTAGHVFFEGSDLTSLKKEELRTMRQHMQIVFQDPFESLNPRHSVGDILEEPFLIHCDFTAQERRKKVESLLERVGLPANSMSRFPHEFSGGQRQRIGIARAIALNPKLIVCDEAVSALDVSIQSQIINLLLELQKELSLTYLFITHDLSVVRHVSDRIIVMYLGKIVEFAPAQALYEVPRHPYSKALFSAIPVPDPTRPHKRLLIKGEIPSPRNPPSGCAFHTRCPDVQDRCRQECPSLRTLAPGHEVACHFAK